MLEMGEAGDLRLGMKPPSVDWRLPWPLYEERKPQVGPGLQSLRVAGFWGLSTKSLVSNLGFRGHGVFNVVTKSILCKTTTSPLRELECELLGALETEASVRVPDQDFIAIFILFA